MMGQITNLKLVAVVELLVIGLLLGFLLMDTKVISSKTKQVESCESFAIQLTDQLNRRINALREQNEKIEEQQAALETWYYHARMRHPLQKVLDNPSGLGYTGNQDEGNEKETANEVADGGND
jgi:hypothetical protein